MSRSSIALAAVVVSLGLAPAAPVPPEALKPGLYYPTTPGAKWTYAGPNGDVEKVVTKVEGDGRRKAVTVGVVGADGVTVPQEKVEVSGEGLVQVEYATLVLTVSGGGRADLVETKVSPLVPPVRLLKLPAKAGDEWDGQMPGGARLSYTVGKPERVKVPAGEFEAVPVALVRTLPGGYSDKFRYWYAPGVGPVKWTAGTGDEFVLKSFTPGKD